MKTLFKPRFLIPGLIFVILIVSACTSYGAGGVYTSNAITESGVYLYGDSKYAETSISYTVNLSDHDTQLLGAGVSIKIPVSLGKIVVFPLANIEYQRYLSETPDIRNLAWLKFGAGLDFPIGTPFYLRAQGMYTPDLFSSPFFENDTISLNNATGYTIKLGVGWRPGVSGRSTAPRPPRTTTQAAQQQQPQPQQQQPQQQQPQLHQQQIRRQTAQSSITLPNRRLTDIERNTWIADYRAFGGPTTVELEVVRLINIVRADHNLSQVAIDDTLMMAARFFAQQANDLRGLYTGSHNFGPYATNRTAQHGASANVAAAFGARLRWNGGNWFSGGSMSAEALVNGWMNSDGHRRYILSPEHRFIGVGQFPGGISYMYLSDQSSR